MELMKNWPTESIKCATILGMPPKAFMDVVDGLRVALIFVQIEVFAKFSGILRQSICDSYSSV